LEVVDTQYADYFFLQIVIRRQKDAKRTLKGRKKEFRSADKRTLKVVKMSFDAQTIPKRTLKGRKKEIQSADKMVGCVWRTSKLLKN